MEKSKNIEFNINKSALFLNECIKIEKNISDINKIDDVVKKCQNSINQEIKLDTNEQINLLIEKIKIFGKIYVMNKFFFDTSIINDDLKKLAICNWIKQKINNNQIKFEKIFTLSKI